MSDLARLLSVYGSCATNAALLLAFEASRPPGDRWSLDSRADNRPAFVVDVLRTPWRPFIDNNFAEWLRANEGSRCHEPDGMRGGVRLDLAPLPAGYDPHGYPGRKIFACVRIDARGRVMKARLIGAVSGTAQAGLLQAIRRQWRFVVEAHGPSGPSWQRVRLDAGPVDRPAPKPSLPLLL